MSDLEWDSTDEVKLDHTMMFGKGYDFFGLENRRREAVGKLGSYLLWPAMGEWSLYRDSDGMYRNDFSTEDEAKSAANNWDKQEQK